MSQLANLLEPRAEELVRRWTEAIREELAPGGKSEPELRDHIPDFLRELIGVLRRGEAPASCAVAQQHGRQRHRIGFSLEALVREYGLLRGLILDLIEETGCPVAPAEVRVLTDFIATAIAEGASEHVRQRERAQADLLEALKEAETRYRRLAEAGIIGIVEWDVSGRLTAANDEFLRMLGYTREDLTERQLDFRALTPPEHQAATAQAIRTLKETGVQPTFEKQYFRKDGSRVDVLISSATLDEKREHSIALILDISARKAAEARAQTRIQEVEQAARAEAVAERQKLHELFLQAPVAICILEGPQHTFTFANPAYRALVGGRDVVGKPLLEALPELRGQGFDELLDRVMATGESFSGDEMLTRLVHGGEDKTAFFNFVYRPKRNPRGEVDGILVAGFEVTQGVLARQRLQESEERLRIVIDAMPHLINFVDVHGRYRLTNRAYETWFGIPLEELRGKTVRETMGEENFRHLSPCIERALKGEELTWEVPFVFRGGRRGFIEGTFLPQRNAAGEVSGYVSLISDITERKQDEARKKGQADFEQQLIGIVSHDLRNPLNAILLGATALVRREELDERSVKSVLRIQSSAERAVRMVKDLLDFTQARLGGGIPMRPGPLDLHTLVRQGVEEVEVAYPGRKVEVRQEGEARGEWDSDRIAQVVTNLVTNALKYSPEGTPVRVVTRAEDNWVSLCVENEGVPIPSEKLPSLFEPLQRATADVDRAGRSVGLGLYIVRHIVDAHGGTITVDSTEEEGTRFTVRLPRKPGRQA